MLDKRRQLVNLSLEVLNIVKKEPDYEFHSLSGFCNKLILEAIAARRKEVSVTQVMNTIKTWKKEDIAIFLQNLINYIVLEEKEIGESEETGEVAIHFVRSLIDKSEANNEDISLLAHELEIDVVKLTEIRNLIYNATIDSCD